MRKVLVLEDEPNIRSFVVINLKRAGYETIEAGDGEEALELIRKNPDIKVALLDIMLPGEIDGFEVCRRIRAGNAQMGIIMLTARTQEMDKVTGLMTGADDYVTKPFSPAELTARVDALYRRAGRAAARQCFAVRSIGGGAIHLPRASEKRVVPKERALWGGTPRTRFISPPCGDMGTSGADKAKKTAGIGP